MQEKGCAHGSGAMKQQWKPLVHGLAGLIDPHEVDFAYCMNERMYTVKRRHVLSCTAIKCKSTAF